MIKHKHTHSFRVESIDERSSGSDVQLLLSNMVPRRHPQPALEEPFYDWERVHSERSVLPHRRCYVNNENARHQRRRGRPQCDATGDYRSATLPVGAAMNSTTHANTPATSNATSKTDIGSSLSLLTPRLEAPPSLRGSGRLDARGYNNKNINKNKIYSYHQHNYHNVNTVNQGDKSIDRRLSGLIEYSRTAETLNRNVVQDRCYRSKPLNDPSIAVRDYVYKLATI